MRRTGGFAGLTFPPVGESPWVVRRKDMPGCEREFDEAVRAFRAAADDVGSRSSSIEFDGFVYEISLCTDSVINLIVDEQSLAPELRWLVQAASQKSFDP